MFKSLKNALGLGKNKDASDSELPVTRAPASVVRGLVAGQSSEWTGLQADPTVCGFYKLDGQIHGRPWRIEQGKPSRDFIKGLELRARGEMNVSEDVAVMIMSRALKNELDKRAFALYTDTLQTQIDPHLPEEMRWLSMYEEVGWEQVGNEFLDQYAILADRKEHAMAWVTPEIVHQLMAWPSSEPDVPRVLMVLRGKVYLRMQIGDGDLPTAEHASRIFTTACDSAVAVFGADVAL
jgi:hypothetical protein